MTQNQALIYLSTEKSVKRRQQTEISHTKRKTEDRKQNSGNRTGKSEGGKRKKKSQKTERKLFSTRSQHMQI